MLGRFLAWLGAIVVVVSVAGVPRAVPAQEGPYDLDVMLSLTGSGAFGGLTNQKSQVVYEQLVNALLEEPAHPSTLAATHSLA